MSPDVNPVPAQEPEATQPAPVVPAPEALDAPVVPETAEVPTTDAPVAPAAEAPAGDMPDAWKTPDTEAPQEKWDAFANGGKAPEQTPEAPQSDVPQQPAA